MIAAGAADLTVEGFLGQAQAALRAAGVVSPRREARLLLAHAMGVPPERLIAWPEAPVPDVEAAQRLVARRAAREPYHRIVGRREFRSLEFLIDDSVLTPRPDSETLVDGVLAALDDAQTAIRLLDLGTGSGCLLLSLLAALPHATGVGVDSSARALAVAGRNAERLGLSSRATFLRSNWFERVSGQFDVVVANPPYVASGEIGWLEPEVALHEPSLALDGGPDGLDAYRAILSDVGRFLAPGGHVYFEVGDGQAKAVAGLCRRAGLVHIVGLRDLAGLERCVVAAAAGPRILQKTLGNAMGTR